MPEHHQTLCQQYNYCERSLHLYRLEHVACLSCIGYKTEKNVPKQCGARASRRVPRCDIWLSRNSKFRGCMTATTAAGARDPAAHMKLVMSDNNPQ